MMTMPATERVTVLGAAMTTARLAVTLLTHLPRPLARAAGQVGQLVARLTHPYRPEKHYMRGPGPKCRSRGYPPASR
ncbi:MAG: hypothetical protein ACTHLY_19615 [Pseudolabrys sp.]